MEFVHEGFIVRPIYYQGDKHLDTHIGLGVPRSNNCCYAAYKAVAIWLLKQGIISICGQILSGAQMAFGVAMASENKIHPVYIPKDGYTPRKHYNEVECTAPYAVIDDIVSCGNAMCETIEETRRMSGTDPMFVIAHQIYSVPDMLLNMVESDIIYTVSKIVED